MGVREGTIMKDRQVSILFTTFITLQLLTGGLGHDESTSTPTISTTTTSTTTSYTTTPFAPGPGSCVEFTWNSNNNGITNSTNNCGLITGDDDAAPCFGQVINTEKPPTPEQIISGITANHTKNLCNKEGAEQCIKYTRYVDGTGPTYISRYCGKVSRSSNLDDNEKVVNSGCHRQNHAFGNIYDIEVCVCSHQYCNKGPRKHSLNPSIIFSLAAATIAMIKSF